LGTAILFDEGRRRPMLLPKVAATTNGGIMPIPIERSFPLPPNSKKAMTHNRQQQHTN
jgi:hypothetical protein